MTTPPSVTAALNALDNARPRYDEAASFYDGTVAEIIGSRKLRELVGEDGQKYRINYARTPVDVMLERTMIQGWTLSDAAVETLVADCWEENDLGIEAKDLHRDAYEFGDAYLIGWPDEELKSGVSLYAHDPRSVRVFYDPRHPRRKASAVHTWLEAGDFEVNGLSAGVWQRVNLYYLDRVEQYVTGSPQDVSSAGEIVNRMGDGDFVPYLDPETGAWPIESPTPGIIPVFHFRTARPYGRPEHADAYGPQLGINKLLISMMGTVDYAVMPQRYALTDSALRPGEAAPADAIFGDEGAINTEGTTPVPQGDMEAGPGSVWLLSGKNVRVGQFEAASMANFIDPIHSLIKQMASVTDISVDRFDKSAGLQSGAGYRFGDIPLNKKTSDRLAQFGVTWREVIEYVCAVNGVAIPTVQVSWAPPETYTDTDSWAAAKLQRELGVPYAQVLKERGYSPDLIEAWEKLSRPVVVGEAQPAAAPVTD